MIPRVIACNQEDQPAMQSLSLLGAISEQALSSWPGLPQFASPALST
jgi:hypothetical protein